MKMKMTYRVPVVEKREYVLLKRLISLSYFHFDGRQPVGVRKLSDLLKSAKVLDEEEMPEDIVRLHTTVTVSQFEADDLQFQIVLPDAVNTKQQLQLESVLSPIGSECFGLGLGAELQLNSEGKLQNYSIIKVKQSNTTKNSISVKQDMD